MKMPELDVAMVWSLACWMIFALAAIQAGWETALFLIRRRAGKRLQQEECGREGEEEEEGEPVGQASGCPFSGGMQAMPLTRRVQAEKKRVLILYEDYIKLHDLRAKWGRPITEHPVLEPSFVAAMHGVELCFLLLANFLRDKRPYVALQHRIELVSKDIIEQLSLIADLVDIELQLSQHPEKRKVSLTQPFPFEGCPPTKDSSGGARDPRGSQSPSLKILIEAARDEIGNLSEADKCSLRKVVRNVSGAFDVSFSRWTVGIGLEDQLNELRRMVGLEALATLEERVRGPVLDYESLVEPQVCVDTYTSEHYEHVEDYFFRMVHLGTECWCFVALRSLANCRSEASEGAFHNAAAHLRCCGAMLEYLGQHVMMLSAMSLRDYLPLKVEIEGTSGAGSTQVKELRRTMTGMMEPFTAAANAAAPNGVRDVYKHPHVHPGLSDYAKALEYAESCLLGGFFFRHYLLACNVIGSDAKGTMNRAVRGLKYTYEAPLFPDLDEVRSEMGREEDERLKDRKGRIMEDLEERRCRLSASHTPEKPAPLGPPATGPAAAASELLSGLGTL